MSNGKHSFPGTYITEACEELVGATLLAAVDPSPSTWLLLLRVKAALRSIRRPSGRSVLGHVCSSPLRLYRRLIGLRRGNEVTYLNPPARGYSPEITKSQTQQAARPKLPVGMYAPRYQLNCNLLISACSVRTFRCSYQSHCLHQSMPRPHLRHNACHGP